MELLVRISGTGLPYEFTKYAVTSILFLGILLLPDKNSRAWPLMWYFLFLIPSIIVLFGVYDVDRFRQSISFNLAGPLCLATAGWFFYRRPVHLTILLETLRQFMLPIISTVSYLFIKTPSLNEIEFSTTANLQASGFGPNQMSSLFGFGILIVGISLLYNWKLYSKIWISYILLSLFMIRGLITFSRGGFIGPFIILFVLFFSLLSRSSRIRKNLSPQIITFFIIIFFLVGTFQYVNNLSSGLLVERFTGVRNGEDISFEKYTSGRSNIFNIDIEIFRDYPVLGIGPGAGTEIRNQYGFGSSVAAHIEFSRLLAEHGILGLFSLLILVLFPIREFFRRKFYLQRVFLFVGVGFCLSFMLHSATRIALPMLMYGMGFIFIILPKKI